MRRTSLNTAIFSSTILAAVVLLVTVAFAHAQTQSANAAQLRATIQAEIMADPRSQTMSQTQLNALVDSLTAQAEAQGITTAQLTYRPPAVPGAQTEAPTTLTNCSGFSCALGNAFGLNGSVPIIPIALFVAAALFILIFSIMREMGHPHAQA